MNNNKIRGNSKGQERPPTYDRIVYEIPKDLQELNNEVQERASGLIKHIRELGNLKSDTSAPPIDFNTEKGISERRINKIKDELEQRLDSLKDVERVIDPHIRQKEASLEAVEKYKSEIKDCVRNILNNSKISDHQKEIVQEFTNQRLSQLKWFELKKLSGILQKAEKDELLNEKEVGFLRYCAYFPFEESKTEKGEVVEGVKEIEQAATTDQRESELEKSKPTSKAEGGELPQSSTPLSTPESITEPSQTEEIERRVLSVEEARQLLNLSIREYLNRYREYVILQIELQRENDPQRRLGLNGRIHEAEMILNNAERLYRKALENYKLAIYFDSLKYKKDYLTSQIRAQKEKIFIEKIKRENPDITPQELENRLNLMIQDEVEKMINTEKEMINREIVGIIVYRVLEIEEDLNTQKLNILREEQERRANFWGRLWHRYQGLSYARKALIGAVIAGVGGGILGVLGGAGFAALGIGATLAGRRFLGGFVVGGGVKDIADRLITKREQKKLNEETQKRIDQIRNEISDIISNPDKKPKDYETWLTIMNQLDKRIDEVLQERENIRQKSNKSRRRWTLIAALIGGLAVNADNIYHLFSGAPPHQELNESIIEQRQSGRIFIPPSPQPPPPSIIEELPPQIQPTGEVPPIPDWLKDLSTQDLSKIPVLVGRGGFWEAAQQLKQFLGLSNQEFYEAWKNSIVTDPISGQTLPLPQAHFIALPAGQQVGLTYDLGKKIFNVVMGDKVKIGGAEELINAWRKATGENPPFRVIWSMMKGGSKI